MRVTAGDGRHRWCRAVAGFALVAALVGVSVPVAQVMVAEGSDDRVADASAGHEARTPLALVPAVAVAAVWIWRARAAAASAGRHVLAPPAGSGGDTGGRTAAGSSGTVVAGDRP